MNRFACYGCLQGTAITHPDLDAVGFPMVVATFFVDEGCKEVNRTIAYSTNQCVLPMYVCYRCLICCVLKLRMTNKETVAMRVKVTGDILIASEKILLLLCTIQKAVQVPQLIKKS